MCYCEDSFTARAVQFPRNHILRTANLDIRTESYFCRVTTWLQVKNAFLVSKFPAGGLGWIQIPRLCVVDGGFPH